VRIGTVSAFVDYHRRGAHHRGVLQPQAGPLLAALLPDSAEIDVINDAWTDPDWTRDYDLLLISCLHSDFDRARQISHYWRRRGAKTVLGGILASTYPGLCAPWFDAIVIGDPEDTVPRLVDDFDRGDLQPLYRSRGYRPLAVPTPRVELMAAQQRLPLGLEATRGCNFACDFCALTAAGTRFETRPAGHVVRDLIAMRSALGARAHWPRDAMVIFYDNNIGGNPRYLVSLAQALSPLGIRWGSCITFNAADDERLIAELARSGCRYLYVGLESFNARTLRSMNKRQNAIARTHAMIRRCHRMGIVLDAGLMLSPLEDDLDYVRAIPRLLDESGLKVPSYICFETPIPGTPHFHKLADAATPALLPNALLRDFTTYTLVTRPRHASAEEFVAAYQALIAEVFAPARRLAKLAHDASRLLPAGGWFAWAVDCAAQYWNAYRPDPDRTYLAATDRPPPEAERVPFGRDDFRDEHEHRAIMQPWAVSDERGFILPQWLGAMPVHERKRRVSVA
jgi:hypothetical protein